MARTHRPGRAGKGESSRPSLFFIIAMIVGFAILVWWFFHFLPKPTTGDEAPKQAAIHLEGERWAADGERRVADGS